MPFDKWPTFCCSLCVSDTEASLSCKPVFLDLKIGCDITKWNPNVTGFNCVWLYWQSLENCFLPLNGLRIKRRSEIKLKSYRKHSDKHDYRCNTFKNLQ